MRQKNWDPTETIGSFSWSPRWQCQRRLEWTCEPSHLSPGPSPGFPLPAVCLPPCEHTDPLSKRQIWLFHFQFPSFIHILTIYVIGSSQSSLKLLYLGDPLRSCLCLPFQPHLAPNPAHTLFQRPQAALLSLLARQAASHCFTFAQAVLFDWNALSLSPQVLLSSLAGLKAYFRPHRLSQDTTDSQGGVCCCSSGFLSYATLITVVLPPPLAQQAQRAGDVSHFLG